MSNDLLSLALRDRALWRRIECYLDHALDLGPSEREQWLADLTATEPESAALMRVLLARRARLDKAGFMEGAPLDASSLEALARQSEAGERIGDYTLDRHIGSGGMGEVWLASRSDGRFEGQFAIKFLDGSPAQAELARRFGDEGRLLARLAHPNIARLLDAGATEDGRQFLVLEYIDGERIDRYCDLQQLDVFARVRLFLDVASAVAHAHAQLVVHRDLKPSNVLVTRQGVVKLLDFGVAKLLSSERMLDESVTRVDELALTPEYAAPEQLLGEIASTATDIYQLGMLLYVLLTGEHPLQLTGTRAERIKAALDGKVPRPSEFAGGALKKVLRGDLDAILMTALDADPLRRYPTAAALREELVRYLNREPVIARRGSALYRVRRFVARHRWSVGGATAAILMLCAMSIVALNQAHVAAEERDRALALASRNGAVTEFLDVLITEASESDKPLTVNDMLARSEELALADARGNPENRAAVLAMIASRYGALGDVGRASQLFQRALALVAGSKDSSQRSLLRCLYAQALADSGQADAAIRIIEQELASPQLDDESAAYCLLYRTIVAGHIDDAQRALYYAPQALERFRASPRTVPIDEALFLSTMGYALHLNGRNGEADRYYRMALQNYSEFGRQDSPNGLNVKANWALIINKAGAPKRALELCDQVVAVLAQRTPSNPPPAYVVANRARALEAIGRYDEARSAYELELELSRQQHIAVGEAHSLSGLASVSERLGDRVGATKYLEDWSATLRSTVAPDSAPWAGVEVMRGRLDLAAGNFETARAHFNKALAKANASIRVDAQLGRAEAELLAGDATAAADDAQHALENATALQGGLPYSNFTGLAWLMLGRAQQQLGDNAHARQAFEAAAVQLSNTVDVDHRALVEARRLAAAVQ